MIKLEKRAQPARLSANSVAWTAALVRKIADGEDPTPAEKSQYRHPEIKAVLIEETHGKCAYCESYLRHVHHGDVEHIYPKSLDPARTFEWQNLTLACEVCNQNKSNRDPLAQHIIDPYAVDPEQHLLFVGAMVFPRGTVLGKSTRAILKLHRAELAEVRNQHVHQIMAVYDQILDTTIPLATRRALYDDLKETSAAPKAPYAAMARSIVRDMEDRLPQDLKGESEP